MSILHATPAEIGLLVALAVVSLAVVVARWRLGPSEPTAERPREVLWGAGAVFVVGLIGLVGYHHLQDPSWTPHGADWDAWYQSAIACRRDLALHPIARWPLNGALAAALDLVSPGPLYQNLQLVSLASAAAAAAGVYLLGHLLLGRAAGLAAAALALLQPYCLEIAQWSSAYDLWAASACWGAAGLVAALRYRRAGWWVLTGLGITGTLATMPKGLPMGVALGGLAVVLALALGRPRLGALGAVVAPVVLVGALYAAFPEPLASLDGLVRYARHGEHDAAVAQAMDFDLSEGYVFGKSSGPATLWRTFHNMRSEGGADPGGAEAPLRRNLGDIAAELDGPSPVLAVWLGLGLLAGLASSLLQPGQRRLAWAWLAVFAVGAAVLPSLWMHLNTRFLLPLFWLLPLPLVAPLAAVSRGGPRWVRPAPLLALLVLVLPGSAWRFAAQHRDPVDVSAPVEALTLYFDLVGMDDLAPLYACADPFTNAFALDAVPGTAGPQGPDNRKVWHLSPPSPGQYLLVAADPMFANEGGEGGPFPCDVTGRALVRSWENRPVPVHLYAPVRPGSP